MFTNERFCTSGIAEEVSPILQAILWNLIDAMDVLRKDYLQVFELSMYDGMQKIVHSQEEPEYRKEYHIKLCDTSMHIGKIFVIDDGDHSTMLKAEEY